MQTGSQGLGPRCLALGDSYTVGESVPEGLNFPAQLGARLGEAGIPPGEVAVLARTGWTCADLAAALEAAPPPGPYDLVTLLAGVNDQYRGHGLEHYRSGFEAVLERARACAGGEAGRVLVLSIPDWSRTPFGQAGSPEWVAAQIDAYNAVNRASAASAGARYVDVTALSRLVQPGWVAPDGLHPSGAQYAAWTELILPIALRILRARCTTV